MNKVIATICILSATPQMGVAATNGDYGLSSTGAVNVSITKSEAVRISNLSDFGFGTSINVPQPILDKVCVYSSTGGYRITASSSNGSGQLFRMSNTSFSDYIHYGLQWVDNALGTSGFNLENNTASTTFNNADRINIDCTDTGGVNSRIAVEVDSATFQAATPDTFIDTLTLFVEPI